MSNNNSTPRTDRQSPHVSPPAFPIDLGAMSSHATHGEGVGDGGEGGRQQFAQRTTSPLSVQEIFDALQTAESETDPISRDKLLQYVHRADNSPTYHCCPRSRTYPPATICTYPLARVPLRYIQILSNDSVGLVSKVSHGLVITGLQLQLLENMILRRLI